MGIRFFGFALLMLAIVGCIDLVNTLVKFREKKIKKLIEDVINERGLDDL